MALYLLMPLVGKLFIFLNILVKRSLGDVLRTDCKNEGIFSNAIKDKALENNIFRSLSTNTAIDCAFNCIPNQRCFSYNYAPSIQKCELSNETITTKPGDLRSRPGTTYYDSGTNAFCQNGGTPQGQCLRHHHVMCSCTSRWTGDDCSLPTIGAVSTMPGPSCRAIRDAGDSAGDTNYWIKPPGVNNPFSVFCHVSLLGVWKKVDLSWFHSTTKSGVAITKSEADGGLIISASVTNNGCGGGRTGSASIIYIKGSWTKIRYKQTFKSIASCWRIFGDTGYNGMGGHIGRINHGLMPFDKDQDKITGEYRMGGNTGNKFSGVTKKCDNLGSNFWKYSSLRYATVTLRRNPAVPLAGIFTASCGTSKLWDTNVQHKKHLYLLLAKTFMIESLYILS